MHTVQGLLTVRELEQYNYDGITDLVYKRAGLVCHEGEVERALYKFVSDCYSISYLFIPWLVKLSKVMFPIQRG